MTSSKVSPTATQPKWVIASHDRVRLLISFAPELDAIVAAGEQFITTRRHQQLGSSPQGDDIEAIATLTAPQANGFSVLLCKKLWVNWRTPVEPPVLLQSALYTKLFNLAGDFQPFLPQIPSPVRLVRFEKFATAT